MKSGAGKVNVSIVCTKLIDKFSVKWIINTGITGGYKPVQVLDVVIGKSTFYHDVDMTSYRTKHKMGQVSRLPHEYYAKDDIVLKFNEFHS